MNAEISAGVTVARRDPTTAMTMTAHSFSIALTTAAVDHSSCSGR
jgi:hypothetical protein